jgi:hypothetical protein
MEDLIEGVDYYMDDNGRYVFTEEFLLRMGRCCNRNCKHCPYKESIMND